MGKIQIKYITRDNNEVKNFRNSFKNNDESFDVTKFLDDFNHFGLIIYKYSKVSGLVFLENDENKKLLTINKIFFESKDDLKEVIDYLYYKFNFYRFIIDDKEIKPSILKNYQYKKENNKVIIYFN